MNQKELKRAEKSLRTSLFKNNRLNPAEKVLAEMLFKAKFGRTTFKQLHQIKIPDTWNVMLYSLYDDLKYGDFDGPEIRMEHYFKILAQEKHGEQHDWLRDDVSDYFKECIINNTFKAKTLFKSKVFKLKVSFVHKKVTLTNLKTKKKYVKEFTLDELVLFNQVKEMIKKV